MIVKFITVGFREFVNDPLAIVIYRFCIIIFAKGSTDEDPFYFYPKNYSRALISSAYIQ